MRWSLVAAGLVLRGKDASAREEKAYVRQIRNTYFAFLPDEAVLLAKATLVLLDRKGLVRLYHPGDMKVEELEPIIERYLESD
jgi:hypothetical protein